MPLLPSAFSHVGATVPELEPAIAWYVETFGMYLLAGPISVEEDDSPLGIAATAIYGKGFSGFQFAHLAGADGMGLELFHFDGPEKTSRRENNFEFWLTGINHFSLTTPDVSAMVDRIVEAGGKQNSDILTLNVEKAFQIVYCEDPWGTVIELCSHPYSQIWG